MSRFFRHGTYTSKVAPFNENLSREATDGPSERMDNSESLRHQS